MKLIQILTLLALALTAESAHSQNPRAGSLSEFHLDQPFWSSGTMHRESLFFVQEDGQPPRAALLFPPTKIISLKSANGLTNYVVGKDFVFERESQSLILPVGSRMPFKTAAQMKPPPGSPHSIGACVDGKSHLFFTNDKTIHELQAEVTYTHKRGLWPGPAPAFAGKALPRTLHKLQRKEPLKVVLLGDSISFGLNASKSSQVPPFMPAYGELAVRHLERVYGRPITFTNFSISGWSTYQGLANIEKIAGEKPDLMILAFGMNDASGRMPAAKFADNIRQLMDATKQQQPQAEFILVASMLGNREWSYAAPELYPAYRDALAGLCGDGVALADLTTMWTELLKHKKFADLTGNNVNHPSDFGHRIYAQVILGLLIEKFGR